MAPPIVTVTRDHVVESVHHGFVVVATPDGKVTSLVGDAAAQIYPRSALKPFQALALLDLLSPLGIDVQPDQLAIMSASHDGGDDPQIAAAALLAEAGLDERALRCPPAWPDDGHVLGQLDRPTTLSHNCSGKHAGMLWAHTATGHESATYLDPASDLQQRIARWLGDVLGAPPTGPGIDGCGAPAWVVEMGQLASAFARLSAGEGPGMAEVRAAVTSHPELVGGPRLPDTRMMRGDSRVVAKRGADGVMGVGFASDDHGHLGIVVKVLDGGDRAAGPAVAAVLDLLGADVPDEVRRPPVLGGGEPHGEIAATAALEAAVGRAFGG